MPTALHRRSLFRIHRSAFIVLRSALLVPRSPFCVSFAVFVSFVIPLGPIGSATARC